MTVRTRTRAPFPWLGLLVAVLFVLAVGLGGLHLAATYRASLAAKAAIDTVQVASVTFPLHASDNLRGMNVFVEVANPTTEPVVVTLLDVSVRGNEQPLGQLNWMGDPSLTIPAGQDKRLHGRRNFWQSAFSDWQEQGVVDIVVSGSIRTTADVLWATAVAERSFEDTLDVHFF